MALVNNGSLDDFSIIEVQEDGTEHDVTIGELKRRRQEGGQVISHGSFDDFSLIATYEDGSTEEITVGELKRRQAEK